MSDRPKIRIVKKDQNTPSIDEVAEDKYVEESIPEQQNLPEEKPETTYENTPNSESSTPQRRLTYTERKKLMEEAERKGIPFVDPYLTNTAPPKEPPAKKNKEQKTKPQTNYPTQHYDEFAKPIPWLKISIYSFSSIAILILGYFFLLPLIMGENEDDVITSESQNEVISQNVDRNGFYIKEMLPAGSEKVEDILSRDMTIRELLEEVGVPKSDVNALENEANKFSIRRLKAGDKYTISHEAGNRNELLMLMIEPKFEPYSFYKLDLADDLTIEKLDKQVEIRENYIAAIVEGTLGQTFIDNNLNLKLISSIEDVLAWSIDLFDVGDGDRFKVLFDEEFVNGKSYRIDKVKALYFEKDRKGYYAFYYSAGESGYFNEFGQSMKRSFLATPIKYGGVITSGYGLRTHPVTGHQKNHLGTDFAAPEGTPIQAVADGVITIADFTSNNGNYVKMKHDNIYETQYLHMQKFGPGISRGSRVKQGDIIGYVGTTGLSTGPHVCYRFWKNSEQVDPMSENIASGSKLSPKIYQQYSDYIEPLKERLSAVNYF